MVEAIHSGRQTGADLAGLDAGLAVGLRTGGWVPRGRRIDGGTFPESDLAKYNLREHSSSAYPPRTEANVIDTDGTVVFGNPSSPGCSLTRRLCQKHKKPCLVMEDVSYSGAELRAWLINSRIRTLNVAGNRERTNPGIYKLTYDTLLETLGGELVSCVSCSMLFPLSDTSNYFGDGKRRCGRCTVGVALAGQA